MPDNRTLLFVALVILALLNLWIVAYTHHRLSNYFLNHYLYGKSRFTGKLSLGTFYKVYFVAALLGLVTFAALAALIAMTSLPEGMSVGAWIDGLIELGDDGEIPAEREGELASLFIKAGVAFYAYIFLVGYFMVALIRAKIRNHVFNNANLDQRVSFQSDLPVVGLWWVMFSNLLLILLTLGFARPFTQVRMARFLANHTEVVSATPLDQFVGEKRQETSAFGDELGDAFDMDMDVGF